MSWVYISVFFVIGFVLGALWMRRHCNQVLDHRAVFIQSAVDRALDDDGKDMTPARETRREGRLAGH
jgi:uncharacterized membrane-anchored protein YhcB (DUF1043 family)